MKRLLLIAGALALGLTISTIAFANGDEAKPEAQHSCPPLPERAQAFERNASGQTIGKARLGDPDNPDLTPWNARGQQAGYVKPSEWIGKLDAKCMPTGTATPDANGDIKIPLYDRSGKVIGEAVVGRADVEPAK